jgi:hypothetical protein
MQLRDKYQTSGIIKAGELLLTPLKLIFNN